MTETIITQNIWQRITKAVQQARQKSYVAVAYMGTGGAELLPLKPGCKLVVDASKVAFSSGQTNPSELLKLLDSGVEIYSYAELHAKVFVIGTRLFIGSTNVSNRSSERLQEAVFTTTERTVVSEARDFVKNLCIEHLRLDGKALLALTKIYKPPRVPQAKKIGSTETTTAYIVTTEPGDLTKKEKDAVKRGKKILQRANTRTYFRHEYFSWDNPFLPNVRDILFIVHKVGRKKWLYRDVVVLHKEPVEETNGFVVFHSKSGTGLPVSGLRRQAREIAHSVKYCKRLTKKNTDILRTIQ